MPVQPARPTLAVMTAPAASASAAVKHYGDVHALDGVTVDFERGAFTAIMGPSGSGKSTLMHCVAGLDSLTAGEVAIGGTVLSRLSDRELTELRRERIGFVFQAFNLLPALDARENITLPSRLGGSPPDADWVEAVIQRVGLADRRGHRPAELSGGQQQRVAVARALAARPQIVFADEPTGNLDSRSGAEILDLLRRSVDEHGQTVVMVTHDPIAAAYTDRVVFLSDGRIVDELRDPEREQIISWMAVAEPAD